jgi:hypothetical protein
MRPHGDPDGLAAAGRALVAAAAELERIGDGLGGLGRSLAGPDVWHGQASEAYRARGELLGAEIGHAAGALSQAAAGLSELSAGLAAAQSLWDRASSLAASAGLVLDPSAPDGPLSLPLPSIDPRVVTAARVAEMTREATEQATSADRAAAYHLAEAATTAARVAAPGAGFRGAPGPAGAGAGPAGGGSGGPGGEAVRTGGGEGRGGDHGGGEGGSLLARGLRVADRIGVAVGGGLAAVEARASALTRLVQSGREPAASLAAVRALAAYERSAFSGTLVAFLPLGGPVITLAANLAGGEDDEPLLRSLVRSLGESIGADAGQRVGMAACAVESAATEGAGALLCPAVAIAATSVGATLGGTAAVRIYDALGSKPTAHPATVPPGGRS